MDNELLDLEKESEIELSPLTLKDEEKEGAIESLLIGALKAKWDIIDNYKSYIQTLKLDMEDQVELIDLLDSIVTDDMINISELQTMLRRYNPNAEMLLQNQNENNDELKFNDSEIETQDNSEEAESTVILDDDEPEPIEVSEDDLKV